MYYIQLRLLYSTLYLCTGIHTVIIESYILVQVTHIQILYPEYCISGYNIYMLMVVPSLAEPRLRTLMQLKPEKICYAFMQLKPEKYAPKTGFMQLFK